MNGRQEKFNSNNHDSIYENVSVSAVKDSGTFDYPAGAVL